MNEVERLCRKIEDMAVEIHDLKAELSHLLKGKTVTAMTTAEADGQLRAAVETMRMKLESCLMESRDLSMCKTKLDELDMWMERAIQSRP